LRFLLSRRQRESLPLLPVSDTESHIGPPGWRSRRARAELEERLERLLTPSELDLVHHHEV
jgi:hypothetical protein